MGMYGVQFEANCLEKRSALPFETVAILFSEISDGMRDAPKF